ncbi:Uncharacterised protein [Vibrio cholerae]|nr:Uncharacterised protein [Vibrio cholerae]
MLFNRAKTARLWLEFRNITVTVFGRQVIEHRPQSQVVSLNSA